KGRAMEGAPLYTGVDTTLDVNWAESSPRQELDPNDFGVRWTGTLRVPRSGTYRLGIIGTMKFAVTLDDSAVVRSVYAQRDGEFPDPRLSQSASLQLEAGRAYRVRVDAQESYGEAEAQLVWSVPTASLEEEALAAARQADAVVLFLGLTARLEGEEMPVQIPGF